MRRWKAAGAAGLLNLLMLANAEAQAPSAPAIPASPEPSYTITLHTRNACVTPEARKLARAEGGFIDVTTPAPNVVAVAMTGTAAANSYLGCTGMAVEKFRLVQDLEITCSDAKQESVALTLDTALVGYVRSKGRAGACVRLAEVCLTPAGIPGAPMSVAYPPLCVEGTAGQLCNQHLPPMEVPVMPVGRYVLTATFVLDTRAAGVCDAHSVADFSPDTTLPPEWVRTRDPFQGVSKKSFGFTATVSAAAPPDSDAGVARLDHDRANARPGGAGPSPELVDRRVRRTPS
jgi:hypothetical protein